MATQKMSEAQLLMQYEEFQKAKLKVQRRQDKESGRLPKGQDSPFGDFPAGYIRKPQKQPLPFKQLAETLLAPKVLSPRVPHSIEYHMPRKPVEGARTVSPRRFGSPRRASGCQAFSITPRTPGDRRAPPPAGAVTPRGITASALRRFYDRGDLPVRISHAGALKIQWQVDIDKLDYHHYMPIFMDGLREVEDPYRFLAVEGTNDMLEKGASRVLPVVPQLIIPIKTALNTRDPLVMAVTLKVLQKMVLSCELVGEALVPYYRQILPVFNIFKNSVENVGDRIDYGQQRRICVGELVEETLEKLELYGGDDAFINIKYMVPTYESCM